MALIKCHECGRDISTEAAACPGCGAPVRKAPAPQAPPPKSDAPGWLPIALVVFVVLGTIWMFRSCSDSSSGDAKSQPAAEAKPSCAKGDLVCFGEAHLAGATAYCPAHIERLAAHSVRWVDKTFELKFSHYRWLDKDAGTITYIGDRVEFQNGFGAYTPMTYECDLAADGKTVLEVRANEGRLPPD